MVRSNPRFLILGLLAAALLPLLFIDFDILPPPYDPLVARVMDALHMPLFAAITLVTFYLLLGKDWRYLFGLLLPAAFGGAVELIQPYTGRSASFTDLVNGMIGVLTGGIAVYLYENRRSLFSALIFIPLSLAFFSLLLIPAYKVLLAFDWQDNNFPYLAGFESPDEIRLWRPNTDDDGRLSSIQTSQKQSFSGNFSLHIVTGARDFGGVVYNARDMNWSPFQELSLGVFNPGEAMRIAIRIDDDQDCRKIENRFNRSFILSPGWNIVRIPIDDIKNGPAVRQLNIGKIRQLIVFTGSGHKSRDFYIDEVVLKK